MIKEHLIKKQQHDFSLINASSYFVYSRYFCPFVQEQFHYFDVSHFGGFDKGSLGILEHTRERTQEHKSINNVYNNVIKG